MTQENNSKIEQVEDLIALYNKCWIAEEDLPIYKWAENPDNVYLPEDFAISGPFRTGRSKYMLQPFEALKDSRIRRVNICKAIQTGGSTLGNVYLLWVLSHERGTKCLTFHTKDCAAINAKSRIIPMMKASKAIAKHLQNKTSYSANDPTIKLPRGSFVLSGPETVKNSLSVKIAILDETHEFAEGNIELALKRTTAYPNDYKHLLISQPNNVGTEWHRYYEDATIYEWGWHCPLCDHLQKYHWYETDEVTGKKYGIVFDKTKMTEDNVYDHVAICSSARFVCKNCFLKFEDTPKFRRLINDNGEYILTKKGRTPDNVSFTWNSLANIDIKVNTLVDEFLTALEEIESTGTYSLIEKFKKQRLSVFYDPTFISKERSLVYKEKPQDSQKDVLLRVMTVDCQDMMNYGVAGDDEKTGLYWVISEFTKNELRIIDFGWVKEFNEIEEIRKKNQIRHVHLGIDSGNRAKLIYNKCAEHGEYRLIGGKKVWCCWTAFKGDQGEHWKHEKDNKTVYRPYKQPSIISSDNNPSFTQKEYVKLYVYSNSSIKDTLKNIMDGRHYLKLVTFKKDEEFNHMMNAEHRTPFIDKYGKKQWIWKKKSQKSPNEAWDCLCMALTFAYIAEIL